MNNWHPVETDCQGLHGHEGDYYKLCPCKDPNDISEVWTLTLTVDDEDGTVMELGRFADVVSAQLYAEQHYAQKSAK
jgi:hypothetical protein